jgi:Ni/Co efflux regulator RcnB
MTVTDLRDTILGVTRDLSIDNHTVAGAVAVDESAVKRWIAGASFPQHEKRERLQALLDVRDHLLDTFDTPEAVHDWMHTDNRYLGGLSPAEVLLAGRVDRVEATITVLDSGMFI